MNSEQRENAPEIKIVPPTLEDVRGVAELYYRTWLATYPNHEAGITRDDVEDRFKDAFTEEALAKRAERIMEAKEGEAFFLAKEGDKVVGACFIKQYPDKNQLQSIYVLPEYQGKGIGKLLWEEAQKYIDPSKDTIVQVATYNTQAINFYKRLGFEETGNEFHEEKFRMKSGAIIPEIELVLKVLEKDS